MVPLQAPKQERSDDRAGSGTNGLAGTVGLCPETQVIAAYERHRDELQGYLVRVTRDPEAAEDLVQEAFLKLLVETRDRQAPDNVRAWLYRVATNAAVSRGRRLRTAIVFEDRVPGPAARRGPRGGLSPQGGEPRRSSGSSPACDRTSAGRSSWRPTGSTGS